MTVLAINRETISRNFDRLRSYVRQTPVLQVAPEEFGAKCAELHLKLELFQHSGSFKARGAFTHMLLGEIPDAEVVAASGGNHGAAVAYAARRFGKAATIFVPEIASPAKLKAISDFGAQLEIVGTRYAEALAASEAFAARTGARTLHAYDQAETLIGQGSVGLELETQRPGLTTVLVAVGGAGLIGGISAWYQGRVKIVAVEPTHSRALGAALDAGRPVDVDVSGIAADSLGAKRVGALAFPLCQTYVEEAITVGDDAIVEAQRHLWQSARIAAEPGGAAALAALISGAYQPGPDERVGVIVCGGNLSALPSQS